MIAVLVTCPHPGCGGHVALRAHGARFDAPLEGDCDRCGGSFEVRSEQLRPLVGRPHRRVRRRRRWHGAAPTTA